jgi:single-stranded DNA-binding protein
LQVLVVRLIGELVWQPEMRFTPSGKAVVSLYVRFDDQKISCYAWETLAVRIVDAATVFRPGVEVELGGYFKTRKWTDRHNIKHSQREFTITEIIRVGEWKVGK